MCRLAPKRCSELVPAVSAWSARWSPDESRFAFMTANGIWTRAFALEAPAKQPASKPQQRPTREDFRKPSGEAAEGTKVLSLAAGYGLDW